LNKKTYLIVDKGNDTFELQFDSRPLVTFTRKTFRDQMEAYAQGNGYSRNWVGSILRLFLKKFPAPIQSKKRTDLERLKDQIGIEGLADYLRSKGFRVVKKISVKDSEIIQYLEQMGYEIQGLLHDVYYETDEFSNKN
jgi:hypothetical protein